METSHCILLALGCAAASAAAVSAWLRRTAAKDRAAELERQAEIFRSEIGRLGVKLEAAEGEVQKVREEKALAESRLAASREAQRAGEKLLAEKEEQYRRTLDQGVSRFKEIAQKILEDRENRLKEYGTNPLSELVRQLKQDIDNLKASISDSNEKSGESHTELMGKIAALVNETNKVTEQANNLAGAIRGDAQLTGEWGEVQLKRILEACGADTPEGFSYQETFLDEKSGRKSKRTDFVVKMPGNRSLIIDSKVTVAAAERYHAAATPAEREKAESEIVVSVRGHVDEIADAGYQASVPNAFPLVLMYIPIEEVYMLAMKSRLPGSGSQELLREYAQRNGVVFVNSASVVPVVRLVEMMWNIERAEKNRQETVRAAEELLQRANDFAKEFLAVETALRGVFEMYEKAKGRLIDAPGGQSIAKAVAKLVQLGVKPKTRGGKTYGLALPTVAQEEDEDG